ncbi:MAG: flagellar assembly protein FliH [Gammaproteobacteria bacterium]|nr:flagellar assembly protein FliH [Gammaproteobacteria bacterium]
MALQKTYKKDEIDAERWQVPVMHVEADDVVRSHMVETRLGQAASSIPTAEQIDSWRDDAEKEGYQEGLERADMEMAQTKQRLVKLIDFFEHPLHALNEEVELQLTQVAVTLAQQLVRRELRIEPGEIVGLIRDSVKLLPGYSRNISIVIHPEDASLVRSALSIATNDDEQSWRLVEDPMITRGGCEIKSESSTINATLENRLSALAASVLGGERERD